MTQPDGERIAKLETEVHYLKDSIDRLLTTTEDINKTLTEARGGWKTLMLVAGVASTLGALISKLVPFFVLKG